MAVTSTVPARESRVNEFAENRAFFVLMAVVCALIDTPAFLRDYMRYIPAGYVRLTGSAAQVSDGCGPVGRAL